jgi:phosphoribosylanthranilate isomerase
MNINKIRTKICGITNTDDALAAQDAGADAIGMVFYDPSPRVVSVAAAAEIVDAIGPFVTSVALLVNPAPDFVEEVLARVKPHLLQFHGDESAEFCERFGRPYLKAIRVREDTDIAAETAAFAGASGFIFDAWSDTLYGGTGKTFNWHKLAAHSGAPSILAGGLTPENVA